MESFIKTFLGVAGFVVLLLATVYSAWVSIGVARKFTRVDHKFYYHFRTFFLVVLWITILVQTIKA